MFVLVKNNFHLVDLWSLCLALFHKYTGSYLVKWPKGLSNHHSDQQQYGNSPTFKIGLAILASRSFSILLFGSRFLIAQLHIVGWKTNLLYASYGSTRSAVALFRAKYQDRERCDRSPNSMSTDITYKCTSIDGSTTWTTSHLAPILWEGL